MNKMEIPILEIYHSLYNGSDTTFLCVAGGNDIFEETSTIITPEKMFEKMKQYKSHKLIITGENPVLYDEALSHFVSDLEWISNDENYYIDFELETDGTLYPEKSNIYFDFISVSIDVSKRIVPEELVKYNSTLDVLFKFRVTNENELLWATDIIEKYKLYPVIIIKNHIN